MKNVLDFIKSHTAALACAVVALLAMVVHFVLIPSLFGELQTKVNERKSVYDALKALNTQSRTLPNVDTESAEPKPLTIFPTDKVIKAGEDSIQRLTDQSGQVLNNLLKMNQRPLLVANSLPNPPTLARQNFLEAYKAITQQYGEGAKSGLIATKLKGVLPPSETEMKDIESAVVNQIIKQKLQIGPNGQPVNQAEVDAEILARRAKLPLEQRVIRALSSQIYVSPGAVDVIPGLITSTTPPDPVMVFNAQFSLWVQSSVFEAIATANSGSENVLTSPVKHLIRLEMPMLFAPPAANTGGTGFFNPGAGAPAGEPVAELKPDASAPITLNYAHSPLGLTSNSMFDPIPVGLTLRVDSRRLPDVLAALQGGQLLKIKNVNYRTVNMGQALQEGYVYDKEGTTPMVEVVLDCEVLMLRAWLVQYMPESVKQHFSTLSSPPAPAM